MKPSYCSIVRGIRIKLKCSLTAIKHEKGNNHVQVIGVMDMIPLVPGRDLLCAAMMKCVIKY